MPPDPPPNPPVILEYPVDNERRQILRRRLRRWYWVAGNAFAFNLALAAAPVIGGYQAKLAPIFVVIFSCAFLVDLLDLLITTPPDAIRLPPLASVRAVGAGTVLLAVVAGSFSLEPTTTILAVAGVWLALTALCLWRQVSRGISPWWTTLFAWHPAAITLVGHSAPDWATASLVVAFIGAVVASAGQRRPRWARVLMTVSGLLTFAGVALVFRANA